MEPAQCQLRSLMAQPKEKQSGHNAKFGQENKLRYHPVYAFLTAETDKPLATNYN